MKPRHRWPLLLFVPSVAAAALIALAAGPAMALLPWLVGDSKGGAPQLTDNALMAAMAAVFLTVLAILLALARRLGKRRERNLPPPPQ